MRAASSTLSAVPTLDQLAADPGLADGLQPAAVAVLLGRVGIAQAALQGRLLAAGAEARAGGGEDRLLTVEQAAAKLATSKDWIYRHARDLGAVKVGGNQVRFSATRLDRYIRARTVRPEAAQG